MKHHAAVSHPDLLVGIGTGDDAGVYSLGDGRALVQTVDIFTPVVDSPRDWGRIAAANALSDIYAMGATPLTALQFLAWPRDTLPFSAATEVIEGGMDVMSAAGCTVVGGHTIDGPEPTYGFAVTGTAALEEVVSNSGAGDGDELILTKPLGMGVITTAIKRGTCPPALAERAIDIMATLNDVAGRALREHGATAATDVTGFGLLGHLLEMCRESGTSAVVELGSVPVMEGVAELLASGMWAGGSQRNLEAIRDDLTTHHDIEAVKPLIDAQTSGGLLISVPSIRVQQFLDAVPGSARIGELASGKGIRVA